MKSFFTPVLLVGAGWLSLASNCAFAQPNVVSIVVPQPAGNPTDGVSRKLQPLLQKELGQTVLVENLPGAGGSIGVQRVLNGPADGSQIVIVSQTEPILTPFTLKGVKYKPEDFRIVAVVARLPYILVSRADLPVRNVDDLAAYAKKQPAGTVTLGNVGPGSMIHLLGEQWGRKNGLRINHVSYKGLPPIIQNLMGGQIDLTFLPLGGNSLALLESGKVKAIATTAAAPSSNLPQVPPISKSGKQMSDFVYEAWIALLVPARTPNATVARLNGALVNAMKDADFQMYVTSTGLEPVSMNSLVDQDNFYTTEIRLYQGLARSIGVESN